MYAFDYKYIVIFNIHLFNGGGDIDILLSPRVGVCQFQNVAKACANSWAIFSVICHILRSCANRRR